MESIKLYYGSSPAFDPAQIFNTETPETFSVFKYRVMYNQTDFLGEFIPYVKRVIRTLKLIENNHIEYSLKFSDRKQIESLYELRGEADEILIVKNGLLTDTSYSNLLFRKGKKYFTPSAPLHRGTAREKLIETHRVDLADIAPDDLKNFDSVMLINAMNTPDDDSQEIPVSNIF